MGLSAAYYRYMHQIHFNELGAHPAVIMSLPLLTVSTACRHMRHEHADEDGMDGMRSWSDSGLGGHVHTLHGQHGPWAHVRFQRLTSAPVLQIAWLMVVFPLFMFLSFQVSFSALTWVVPL